MLCFRIMLHQKHQPVGAVEVRRAVALAPPERAVAGVRAVRVEVALLARAGAEPGRGEDEGQEEGAAHAPPSYQARPPPPTRRTSGDRPRRSAVQEGHGLRGVAPAGGGVRREDRIELRQLGFAQGDGIF